SFLIRTSPPLLAILPCLFCPAIPLPPPPTLFPYTTLFRSYRPAFPRSLLRGDINTVDVPQLSINTRVITQTDIATANRRTGHDFSWQQAHRKTVCDQRQKAGWAQR